MKFVIAASLPAVATAKLFGYDPNSDVGPIDWPGLPIPENACGGASQSGIDIPSGRCDETQADYVFEPGTCTLDDFTFTLYGYAIQANYPLEGCTPPRMRIPGIAVPFDALQFHLHTGTDHAIDGTYFGADMHIVHKEVGGSRYAVLGYFLEPTSPDDNNKFSDLLLEWEAVEAATSEQCSIDPLGNSEAVSRGSKGDRARKMMNVKTQREEQLRRKLPRSFNPYALVPEGSTMYFYQGSLTTPPCSEIVTWNVVDKPVQVSVREYLRLTNLILDYVDPETCKFATVAAPSGFTGRPVQPINGRTITHKCPTGTESRFKDEEESPGPTASPTRETGSPTRVGKGSSASTVSLAVGLLTAVIALFA